MSLYFHIYSNVLKRNFILVIVTFVLLILTFFAWAGVPLFLIGNAIANLTPNLAIMYLCISLSGGLLFSLLFVPINLEVAKRIAEVTHRTVVNSFIRIEILWILVCSLMFILVITAAQF